MCICLYQVLSSTDRPSTKLFKECQEPKLLWQQQLGTHFTLVASSYFPRGLSKRSSSQCAQISNGSEMNLCHCCGHHTVGKGQRIHLSDNPKKIIKRIPSAKIAGGREIV